MEALDQLWMRLKCDDRLERHSVHRAEHMCTDRVEVDSGFTSESRCSLRKGVWTVARLKQDWNIVVALINTLVCTYESSVLSARQHLALNPTQSRFIKRDLQPQAK